MESLPLLSLITFLPLLGMILLLFVPKDRGSMLRGITIVVTVIPLLLAAWIYSDFNTNLEGFQYREQYNWIEFTLNKEPLGDQVTNYFFQLKYHLAVDGLSMPLVLLTSIISLMAAFASFHIKKRWKTFYTMFLLLQTGMYGVFMAQDLILFFLFFELTLIPMFFLIGIWGYKDRESAANKFLIYNGLGSAVMLIAFLILISTAGLVQVMDENGLSVYYTADWQTIFDNLLQKADSFVNQGAEDGSNPFFLSAGMKTTLFFLMLVAFGIKLPIFPFHTWMLKVHTEAPPSIVMIHSGILLKMGGYGLIRYGVLLFPEQVRDWAWVLAALGLINILYGAVLAFVQKEFKLVLAYSSISHMGIVLLGIAALNTIGLEGAIFQLISHGLISALLFLLVGSIYERTQTTELGQLGGLASSVPFISGILLTAGMASLGLPALSGFVSEFLAFLGFFQANKILAVIAALGIILGAVYVLRGIMGITFGPISEAHKDIKDARLIEAIPMIILVALILLLGVYPHVLTAVLQQTVGSFDHIIQTMPVKIGG